MAVPSLSGFPCVDVLRSHHTVLTSNSHKNVSIRLVEGKELSSLHDNVLYGILFASLKYPLKWTREERDTRLLNASRKCIALHWIELGVTML